LGKTQKKHLGDLPPTVPDLPPFTPEIDAQWPLYSYMAKYFNSVQLSVIM